MGVDRPATNRGVLVPVALVCGVVLDHLAAHTGEQLGGCPDDGHVEGGRVVALDVEEGHKALVLVLGGGGVGLIDLI